MYTRSLTGSDSRVRRRVWRVLTDSFTHTSPVGHVGRPPPTVTGTASLTHRVPGTPKSVV